MDATSFTVTGTRESLERLRSALLKEPQAAQVTMTELAREPAPPGSGETRVRQPWEEHVWMFVIHTAAGIVAHTTCDWLRKWLKDRADAEQVRVKEKPSPSAPAAPSDEIEK
jgi:hypothetical protein